MKINETSRIIYQQAALRSFLRSDHIAQSFIEQSPNYNIKSLEQLYAVSTSIKSKKMIIEFVKVATKQFFIAIRYRVPGFEYLNPENINTNVTDDELMLLINDATTVNETSHPHNHSIVFLVAKNIIFNLIGVNASATLSSLLQNNQSNSINNISFRTEPPLQNQFLTTFDSSTLVSTSTSVPHSSPTDTLPLTSSYLSTEVNDRKNDVTDVLPSVELQSLVACSETNASPMPVSSSSVHIDNSKPDNDILNHSEQNETLSNSSLSSIDLKIHANTKMYKEQGSLQLIDDDNNSLSEDTKHLSYDYENNNVDNISNFDYDGDQKSNYENLKHERSDPIINFDDNDEELGNSNKILDEYRDFTEYFMT
ncbi:hypothetical protein KQX54_012436 [Cotesia glomerata]|uniref:Uncharacterized protein n=1 Tax=Cotesia glomerata TaxID=32391 RepID=A0AAV7IK89_COTGL|nr:hypothetical protein KQX54_012436 [Cotesia glomerata]